MKSYKPLITWGCDISIKHGAIVQLRNGKLDQFWYWTGKAGAAAQSKKPKIALLRKLKNGTEKPIQCTGVHFKDVRCPQEATDANHAHAIRRERVREFLRDAIAESHPDFAGIEDYAFGAAHGAHQIGEVGGTMRSLFWESNCRWREHDISSIKMFATGDGGADKTAVRAAVRKRWGADFSRYDQPKGPRAKKQDTATSEDLSDAYVISKLVYWEAMIRAGRRTLEDLKTEKERRVFLRTTRVQPINLLAREWICREA